MPMGLPRLDTKWIMARRNVLCSGVEISVMNAAMPMLGIEEKIQIQIKQGLLRREKHGTFDKNIKEVLPVCDVAPRKCHGQVDGEEKKFFWPGHEVGVEEHGGTLQKSGKKDPLETFINLGKKIR